MSRLIETINVKNGSVLHFTDHQERMDRSVFHFFGTKVTPDLESLIIIPEDAGQNWFKCRVVYGQNIEKITWSSYSIRKISTLSLVHSNDIDYNWKYEDRSQLEDLIRQTQSDDVIIVKDGRVTDSSYANVLFRCGNEWITPSTPLLRGTQRKRLLESGVIREELIHVEDLYQFDRIKWINAMLDMKDGPEWPMDVIQNL